MICDVTSSGSEKTQVQNQFKHREDNLLSRVENTRNGQIQECFGPGRPRALKGTSFKSNQSLYHRLYEWGYNLYPDFRSFCHMQYRNVGMRLRKGLVYQNLAGVPLQSSLSLTIEHVQYKSTLKGTNRTMHFYS